MPAIASDLCTQCMKCVKDCPSDAIEIGHWHINDSCIHCGHCVAVCPEQAVKPEFGDVLPVMNSGIDPLIYRNFTADLRSCRSYKDKAVPSDLLDDMITNMSRYPSASNKRTVQVTAVMDRRRIQELNDLTAKTLLKAIGLLTHPIISPFVNLISPQYGLKSLEAYKQKYAKRQEINTSQICHGAPLVLLFHGPAGKYSLAKDDALIWATYTTHYAHSAGLGSCFIGFIVKAMERSKGMRTAFGIPDTHQVFAALTVGYPKTKYLNEVSRKPPEYNII
ncbi:nitroreductase family protein [Saccharicrinis sp. FJH54]|uniref:nitroreductase family protein n=1 Tax=Saccharicrinis sp. FJH54 TaxID=3344665 RepID=UPI0035D43358